MKLSSMFGSVVVACALGLVAGVSHAQVAPPGPPAWRCEGEDCTDAIVNDVADVTVSDWPGFQFLSIAGLPYSCTTKIDQCPHCFAGGDPSDPAMAQRESQPPQGTTLGVITGTIPWSLAVSGLLRSFLFGTYTASTDLLLTVQPSVGGSWAGTDINYLFQGACTSSGCSYVQAPGGDTGVVDLGAVSFSTAAGDFWNASLQFDYSLSTSDIITSCSVGYGSNRVTVHPVGTHLIVSYPVAWTPVKDVLAEAVRYQFRRAARFVVTGSF